MIGGTARFEFIRRIGRGGMGLIYEARERATGSLVAVKTIRHLQGETLYRFKKEFRSLVTLRHRNVVELYELFSEDRDWYFSMELVPGVDFISWVRPHEPPWSTTDGGAPVRKEMTEELAATWEGTEEFSVAELLAEGAAGLTLSGPPQGVGYDEERLRDALQQLCHGVHAIHRHGKLHRDLKPANVLVTGERRVVILDFGLVTDDWRRGPERDGPLWGTPAYMAPESFDGHSSQAGDWYSVGAILYQALTGAPAFAGPTEQVLIEKQRCSPPAPAAIMAGVDPGLSELCMRLLAILPHLRPDYRQILEFLGAEGTTLTDSAPPQTARDLHLAFVGRETELARLRECWERTAQGEPIIAVVTGPSGIGKTHLVSRFMDQPHGGSRWPEGTDAVRLSGRCLERESVPYKAFDAVIDGLTAVLAELPKDDIFFVLPLDVRYLVNLFPVLQRVGPVSDPRFERPAIADPLELRERAFAVLRELLGKLARIRPVVISIDDIQWADKDSLDLLVAVTRRPDAPALLLLATQRHCPASPDRVVDGLERYLDERGLVERLELGPLSERESSLLCERLLWQAGQELAERGLHRQVAERVARESSGSPLLIGELARYLATAATPEELSDAPPLDELRLASVLLARAQRLPPESRTLLRLVAVARDPLPQAVLSAASELPMASEGWKRGMDALVESRMVRRRGTGGADLVEAYHERISEIIAANLPAETRRAHHRELAVAHEAQPTPRWIPMSRHWLGAAEPKRARTYLWRAAEEAERKLAFDQAAQLCRSILELGTDRREQGTLWRAVGDSLGKAGRPRQSADAYQKAAAYSDSAARNELRHQAAYQLVRGGYLAKGVQEIRSVLAEVGIRYPRTPRRALFSYLVGRAVIWLRGMRHRSREAADVPPMQLLRLQVLWTSSSALGVVDPMRGAAFEAQYVRTALRVGELSHVTKALLALAAHTAVLGGRHLKRARKAIHRAGPLVLQSGEPRLRGLLHMVRCMVAYFGGDWREAVEHGEQAEKLLKEECHGAFWELETVRLWLSFGLMQKGALAQLAERYDRQIPEARRLGDRYTVANYSVRLNIVRLARDELDEARRAPEDALASWPEAHPVVQRVWLLFAQMERDLYLEQPERALERLDADLPELRKGHFFVSQFLRLELAHLEGRAALASAARLAPGERALLLARARKAVGRLRREKMAFGRAWAALVAAGVAVLEGRSEPDCHHQLNVAIDLLEATDCGLLALAAKRQRGALLGGEAGAAQLREAEAALREQGVKSPARMSDTLAPGLVMSE